MKATNRYRKPERQSANTMGIGASFYKNVFLLTQKVPTSDDFRKHFREAMFDKPNTVGFIHVSHFLLTMYDAERFKRFVEWPILCKRSEAKYRNEVKEFLGVISKEHPEAGFPGPVASYLLHAGGPKFTTFMWKLSQLVLYVYIKRELKNDVLSPPESGVADDSIRTVLKNHISNTNVNIVQINSQYCKSEEEAKAYAKEEANDISNTQTQLFERRRVIATLTSEAPVADVVKKRLTDIEDSEIIHLWRESILDNISQLRENRRKVMDGADLSNDVMEMATSMLSGSRALDVSTLPKIDDTIVSRLPLPPETQAVLSRLYIDGNLVLQTLLTLLSTVLHKWWELIRNHRFRDLTDFQLQVEASCEDMKSMCSLFHALLSRNLSFAAKIQDCLRYKKLKCTTEVGVGLMEEIDGVLFMSSPPIKISTNHEVEEIDGRNSLALTPEAGAHKTLFSRHRRVKDITPQSTKLRTNLLVSRINLDDTLSSLTSESLEPYKRRMASKLNLSVISKTSVKYLRLFSGPSKKHISKVNYSMMSAPNSPRANSTILTNRVDEASSIKPEYNLELSKSLYNLSKKIVNVVAAGYSSTEKRTPTKQWTPSCGPTPEKNESQAGCSSREKSPIPKIIVSKPFIDEGTEIELVASNDGKPKFSEPQATLSVPGKVKRRSISDLVERYRKVLESSVNLTNPMETSEHSNASK